MGIILALLGAVCLAIGTDVQHRGVRTAQNGHGSSFTGGTLRRLLFEPVWLGGTILILVAVALQLGSLLTANLVVVQPIGVIGLVVTAWLASRRSHRPLSRSRLGGIVLCILGIGSFVIMAVIHGREGHVTLTTVIVVIVIFVVVAIAAALVVRAKPSALTFSMAGAVMFGFVATLAQVLLRDLVSGHPGVTSIWAASGMAVSLALGSLWVQNAHAKGTSTLVLAGLTVVDPLTGVLVTGIVFGELAAASPGTLFAMLISGLVAFAGVLLVSRE